MHIFDSSVAILKLSKSGVIQGQNDFFIKSFGYTPEESHEQSIFNFLKLDECDESTDVSTRFSTLTAADEFLVSGSFLHRYYYHSPVKVHFQLDDVDHNIVIARFLVVQNIGYDNIIDMPNGWAISSVCRHYFSKEKEQGKNVGYIIFDIDSFSSVNFRYGYDVGDKFLRITGRTLQKVVGESNVVARFSNSRFAMCIKNPSDLSVTDFELYMLDIADKICQAFNQPILVDNDISLQKNYSLGVCTNASMYTGYRQMDTATEKALHLAKRIGETVYKVAKLEYVSELNQIRIIIDLLPKAIEQGGIDIHYQPQYSLDGSTLIGFEALSRWYIPECGAISPLVFVQYAENLGLFVEFDMSVLQKVCRQIVKWEEQGINVPKIAVNMSLKTLESNSLIEKISQILTETGCKAEQIEIEITETSMFSRFDTILENITELHKMGIDFSMDDFGSGYSSLSLLSRLAFALTKIKLDIELTNKVSGPDADIPFVQQIIGFKDVFDVMVLAEGVETQEQKNALMKMNCDYAQGYFYSRPLTLDATLACLLKAN